MEKHRQNNQVEVDENALLKSNENLKEEKFGIENDLFDNLIEVIGNDHKFQFRFNLIYNFFLVFLVTISYLNIVLAMTIPDHWCFVPGRGENVSIEEWRNATLPREIDSKTLKLSHSHCNMYSLDDKNKTVECSYGWEYDRQWYSETGPSQENWVCQNELLTTNTFAAGRIGEIIGSFVFGQLGDILGRRPVFYISMTLLIAGRVASAFSSHNYTWFLITIVVGSMATTSVFQSPLVICMEVSSNNRRADIAFLQCVGWVMGMCALPMIAWIVKDWSILMIVTSLPCLVFFFTYKLLPESPRWLASRGHVKKSAKTLQYIADINGRSLPKDTISTLQKIADKKEKIYGIPSLFSSWRLAKNSIIVIICWVICGLTYYILVLNVSNMEGNPFMNFFWQSLVELPGYVLGRGLSDKFGRRWTQTGTYLVATVSCCLVILLHNVDSPWLQLVLVLFIKCGVTLTFYIVWLQAMEIYPTCVRQTGTSMGGLVSNFVGIAGPYIVYLGQTYDARIPYAILLIMTLVGGILSSFLPETYNKKLPETLEDAQHFGKEQKYWGFALK